MINSEGYTEGAKGEILIVKVLFSSRNRQKSKEETASQPEPPEGAKWDTVPNLYTQALPLN